MILLTSTSDEIRVTADVANVHISASYVDLAAGVTTPGRLVQTTSGSGTVTAVASPAASTYRAVEGLFIRNTNTLEPTQLTVVHRASGPVDVELIKVLLQPGDTLAYNEHDGFRYMRGPYGTMASAHDRVWLDPAVGALYTSVLPASVARGSATARRLADVQDLQFPVREGHRYWFHFALMYTSAATGTGSRWSIYGPGSVTLVRYVSEYSLTTTTKTSNEGLASYDVPAGPNATSATTGSNLAFIEGFVDTPTCDGIVYLRFGSEVSNSNITLLKGSRLEWQRVT